MGRWRYIVLQSVQGYKCRRCRVLGEPGLMGDYETKERSNACSGRGQGARGLAAHDRETPLQPRVLLDRMVVVVGGGCGVQAYAVISTLR